MKKELSKRQTQVKKLRIVQKLTLEKVAKLLRISIQRVWQIEQEIYNKELCL